jgi:beta-glucanase (GH16 family)
MKTGIILTTIGVFCIFLIMAAFSFAAEPIEKWRLVWSDEFNYTGEPDQKKWDYDEGCTGWGNGEAQCYTKARMENARVEDGKLILEARHDGAGRRQYTSARLKTKGRAQWMYGRIEVCAKLPSGRGIWPAIWMLPEKWSYGKNFWPDNGEIDIMEAVGYHPGQVHSTVHTYQHNFRRGDAKSGKLEVPDAASAFHVYAMEWSPDRLVFFVDDQKYFTFFKQRNSWYCWPFDNDFYLLINLAVGGSWGGRRGIDNTIFPQKFEIDYVRVYQ